MTTISTKKMKKKLINCSKNKTKKEFLELEHWTWNLREAKVGRGREEMRP